MVLELYFDGWIIEYRLRGEERLIVVLDAQAMQNSGWKVHLEPRVAVNIPARLQDRIGGKLVEAAETLAELIPRRNPFWRTEQGVQLRTEGWQVEYRVDLEGERIFVLAASRKP